MIAKHDLLKRLRAFVHSHLIPTLVCSVGAQQTSFRICSTYLYVVGKMGENIKWFSLITCRFMLNDAQKYRSKARNKYCIIKFVFKICETRN